MVNGTYVLRRLIVVIPTLLLVTAFTFWLQNSRGDKRDLAFNILGPGATEAGVEQIVKEFHLDEPMWRRYLLWLSDALRGDLGRSAIQGQEVSTAIANADPGVAAADAVRPDPRPAASPSRSASTRRTGPTSRGDRVTSTVALTALSIPNFVLAIVLVLFFALGGISIGPATRSAGVPAGVALRAVRGGPGRALQVHGPAHDRPRARPGGGVHAGAALGHDLHAAGELHHHGQGQGRARPADPVGPRPATVVVHAADRVRRQHGDADRRRPRSSRRSSRCPASARTIGTAIFQKDFLVVQGVVVVIAVGFILINFLVDLLYAVLDPRVRHVRA